MDIDLIFDVLIDAAIDTAKLVPFLLLTYVAMEALEHAAAGRTEELVARADKSGPAIGALLGALPQCGFSAMAATLYAGRVITVGTLVAVILSTSDEMIPVFLAHAEAPGRLATIIAIKVVVGCVAGFALDGVLRLRHQARFSKEGDTREALAELVHDHEHYGESHEHEGHDDYVHDDAHPSAGVHTHHDGDDDQHTDEDGVLAHAHVHGHAHDHAGTHTHDHSHGGLAHILRSAVSHTLEVTVFIFLVSLAFGLVIEGVGEDAIAAAISVHPVRATLVAALIGLIPNCGASVALTELFLAGTLPTGAMMAGLLVSGGVGLLVLFRVNGSLRQNLLVCAMVYATGVVCGLVVGASGILL